MTETKCRLESVPGAAPIPANDWGAVLQPSTSVHRCVLACRCMYNFTGISRNVEDSLIVSLKRSQFIFHLRQLLFSSSAIHQKSRMICVSFRSGNCALSKCGHDLMSNRNANILVVLIFKMIVLVVTMMMYTHFHEVLDYRYIISS